MNGTCLECNNPIPRNSKEKTLQFSIEIFTEFFEKFDELFTPEQKKVPIQFLKGLIYSLSKKNSLENEKIIQLQSIVKNIGRIGGNAIGGAITMDNGKPGLQMLKDFGGTSGDPMSRVKSLSAVILAIQYILEFKVKNEFVLETVMQLYAQLTPLEIAPYAPITGDAAYRGDLDKLSRWKNQALPRPYYHLMGTFEGRAHLGENVL